MTVNLPEMLTPKEVADILKISYESALAFIKYSGVDYIKVGRQYRVTKDKLNAFLMKKGSTIVDIADPIR